MEEGKFAIHEAARNGQLSVAESLLSANSRLATRRDDDDRLPLHWACSYNHMDIVQLLASRPSFDPDVKDGLGWTPLMITCNIKDSEPLFDLLLSRGADINEKNSQGQVALHFCASKAQLDLARKLVAKGANARVKDKRQQTPLMRAAAVGSAPLISLLLEAKAPLNATDYAGQTALHHAIAEGHGDAALMLLRAGAEVDKEDEDGKTALQLAPDDKVLNFITVSAEREGIDLPNQP